MGTAAAFIVLTFLLVYGILRVPLPRPAPAIDLTDRPASPKRSRATRASRAEHRTSARIVFVDLGIRSVTIDGVTADGGEPFTIEVARPVDQPATTVDTVLTRWAFLGTVVDLAVPGAGHGGRARLIAGDTALDVPLVGALGLPAARHLTR